MLNIAEVQEKLAEMKVEGWLLYDFQGLNPIAKKLAGLQGNLLTRRWFCWIPRTGTPVFLVHQIEKQAFSTMETPFVTFKSWDEMTGRLAEILGAARQICMEFSPRCAIPYVSRVDAGTLELIQGLGKQISSSANLVQYFEACWSRAQLEMHLEASRLLMQTLFETFEKIRGDLRAQNRLTEYSVQQFMMERFEAKGLATFFAPIIAVNAHSGNPHYEPSRESSTPVRAGDFLLIDWWARMNQPDSVYADYTWVTYLGEAIPEKYIRIWEIVKGARDGALQFIRGNFGQRPVMGWEADRAAREIIQAAGYGDYFIHRTGHNIGEQDHGNGANLDDLETHDERELIPRTCFSIEPGIYLEEFGVRSEINVYLDKETLIVTGDPVQQEIYRIY